MKQKGLVIQYLLFSIISIILLLLVVLFYISTENNLEINDKLIVGLFFIISCLIGISVAIHPGGIKRHLKIILQRPNKINNKKPARKRLGHHPDCDRFKNHTIKINGRIYCAGCMGLTIGCIISIIIMIIYVSFSFSLYSDIFLFFTIFGFLIIGFVFVEILINNRNTLIHIISNSLFVIGFLIIVIGFIEITGDKIFGIISIIFSFLWLDTRIQLSNWHHSIICKNCNKTCKTY